MHFVDVQMQFDSVRMHFVAVRIIRIVQIIRMSSLGCILTHSNVFWVHSLIQKHENIRMQKNLLRRYQSKIARIFPPKEQNNKLSLAKLEFNYLRN